MNHRSFFSKAFGLAGGLLRWLVAKMLEPPRPKWLRFVESELNKPERSKEMQDEIYGRWYGGS